VSKTWQKKSEEVRSNVDVVAVMLHCSTGYYIEPTVIETKDPTNVLMREVRFR